MALLTKLQIISADDLKTQDVPVPEWGGTVRIKAATPAVIKEVRAAVKLKKGEEDDSFGYRLMAQSIVDESGNPVFDLADVAALESKSMPAVKRVMDAINELNAFSKKAEAGNDSAQTQSDVSTSN
jgi:Mn-containing catalase